MADPGSPGATRRGGSRRLAAFASAHKADLAVAALLATAGAVVVAVLAFTTDPRFFEWNALDVWFESDPPRILEALATRWSPPYVNRVQLHPLFLMLVFPPVQVLRSLVGLQLTTAVSVVLAFNGALWTAAFYITFRLIGLLRLDAVVFTLLALTSAAGLFWLGLPETYPFASSSIVFALMLTAAGTVALGSPVWDVAAGILTFGITFTNWVFALLATLSRRSFRSALTIGVLTIGLVTGLWAVQHTVFPSTQFFIGRKNQDNFMFAAEAGGPARVAASFFAHTVVMPEVHVVERPGEREYPIMRTQTAAPGSNGMAGAVALGLWAILLIGGGATAIAVPALRRPGGAVVAAVAAQLGLHMAFGHETFLYSLDFAPALIFIAALATLSRWRRLALGLAVTLLVIGGWSNVQQFARASMLFDRVGPFRHDIASARASTGTPGPRAAVRLDDPGSGLLRRAVHARGGGFSPALFRFSIAVHVVGPDGTTIATSDDMPETSIVERNILSADSALTGIETTTPFYRTKWTVDGASRRSLELELPDSARNAVVLAVRGIGTQDGALRTIDRVPGGVLANGRWALTCEVAPSEVLLDVEMSQDDVDPATAEHVSSDPGWARARLVFREPGTHHCRLDDRRAGQGIERFLFVLE